MANLQVTFVDCITLSGRLFGSLLVVVLFAVIVSKVMFAHTCMHLYASEGVACVYVYCKCRLHPSKENIVSVRATVF